MIFPSTLIIFPNKYMALAVESNLAKNPLTPFITALLEEAKLHTLPEEYRENYQRRLEGMFLERLGFAALKALPASDIPRAEELSEKEKYSELTQLFQKSIPNFAEILQETMRSFREDFLASTTESRAQATA